MLDPSMPSSGGSFPAPSPQLLTDMGAEQRTQVIDREHPEPPVQRAALVKQITREIQLDRAKWSYAFKRMREDMAFARKGASKAWAKSRYVANIVQRHIAQRVAALYAKNPTIVAKRRKTLDFRTWDETPESLMQAMEALATGMLDPNALELLNDFQQGMTRRRMMTRLSTTLQIVLQHVLTNQPVPTKRRMKQVVRRALTVGVAYVKITFTRDMEMSPERSAQVNEMRQRLSVIEARMADLQDGEEDRDSSTVEELRISLEALQSTPDMLKQEGILLSYPRSTSIIPHRACFDLLTFSGCDHVTEEFMLTCDEVKEIFKVDVGKNYKAHTVDPNIDEPALGAEGDSDTKRKKNMVRVWGNWSRKDGVIYWLAEGFPDFLQEPAAPDVATERFWPWYPVIFNECEDEDDIFAPSDVELIRHPQEEHNRSRHGLREHRKANQPKYVTRQSALSDDDKTKLRNATPHEILELQGLGPTQKVDDLLQTVKHAAIDPATYDVSPFFEDVLRVVGSQEANLGGTSGATATESSIAESSRMSAQSSNVDDLDDTLTEIANGIAQIALREYSFDTVTKIAGPGAVWPTLAAQDIADELFAEIQAGSSGRPNKVQEIQNFQRMAPLLMQVPGIRPEYLAREGLQRMDDRLDLTDAIMPGIPSIQMLNRPQTAGAGTGDPNGQKGGDNADKSGGDKTQNRPGAPPQDPNLSGSEPHDGGGQVIHYDAQGGQVQ